jgi:hypothetical protein
VLNQLTRDLKARDYIIKELSDRLSKTADAAESVVSAVHTIDKESQIALSEVDHLHSELRRAAQEAQVTWCLMISTTEASNCSSNRCVLLMNE